jgi:hypothetical protein
MSEMSSILSIALYQDVPSHHEPKIEKGSCRSGCSYPGKLFPFQSGSLREEPEAARRDAQYAAHAAHAVDPSVLDAGPTAPFWMPAGTSVLDA